MANEPEKFRRGDTVKWSEDFSADHPADDGWVLTYYFGGETKLDIVAVANGKAFDITLATTDTAKLVKGIYTYQGRVKKGIEEFTLTEGRLEVTPDLKEELAGFESRTQLQIWLDQVEQAITDYTVRPVEAITVAGRTLTRPPLSVLFKLRNELIEKILTEKKKERVDKGLQPGGLILSRMRSVS